MTTAVDLALKLFEVARPVLRVESIAPRQWARCFEDPRRRGPWPTAEYVVLDAIVWRQRVPSLYFVGGADGAILYVGTAENRIADRWRLSPACNPDTGEPLPRKELFHSECFRHMVKAPQRRFPLTVKAVMARDLAQLWICMGGPRMGWPATEKAAILMAETYFCQNQSDQLAPWNTAKTGK